ncbi:NepR family anti-sigma factor [Ensifer adhaerens]|uniref:NepR family anti-sigma factor n=1 Tax=Ensifer adhaerens TaxID=106592 RepID=UPI000CF07078
MGEEEKRGEAGKQHGDPAETLDLGCSIGASLKALYRSLEQEPVPELFLDLLEKLDQAEAAAEGPSKGRGPL